MSKPLLLGLYLNIIKVAMMVDAYFGGLASYHPLRTVSTPLLHRIVISTYRSILSVAAISLAIRSIHAFVPLIYVHLLGSDWCQRGDVDVSVSQWEMFSVAPERATRIL